MPDHPIFNEASDVQAKDGAVSVVGPDGAHVLLTPDAAELTSDRLMVAAAEAQGQSQMRKRTIPENKGG